jgi:Tfp pilus assembly protein PilF
LGELEYYNGRGVTEKRIKEGTQAMAFGVATQDCRLVTNDSTSAIDENRQSNDETRPVLLSAAGESCLTWLLFGAIVGRGDDRNWHMWVMQGKDSERRLPYGLVFLFACLITDCIPVLADRSNAANGYAGSLACATCHSAIYKSYSGTPMANASGKVPDTLSGNPPSGEFLHALSGVRYRIFPDQDAFYFEFRKNGPSPSGQEIHGRRRIQYYIGSGSHARGYMFETDGFLFQVPVSYYSARGVWDMAPGYENYPNIFLGRRIEEACLECHASGVRVLEGGRYDAVPFAEGAVACERCHGPGQAHIARMMDGANQASIQIVNPVRLPARRRDSICAQCHLSGEARVPKASHSLSTFRPGDLLSDHVAAFVWSSGAVPERKVIGHFEGFWKSRCKQAAGDRFWCGSCHDPHSVPAPSQSGRFFRAKCLSCHQESSCTLNREARMRSGDDCISCHMPKTRAVDGLHTSFTDHSIPRVASTEPSSLAGGRSRYLASFWGDSAESREVALAYAEVAARTGKTEDYSRAFSQLRSAVKQAPADHEVLTQLGYMYERMGDSSQAILLYQRALQQDSADNVAAVNLAGLLAERGQSSEAMQLWRNALSNNPGLEAPGINLSKLYLEQGNPAAAAKWLASVLEFSPDSPHAWRLWSAISSQAGDR